MIIFIADGRLGNQLFQLAFLKTIAKKKEFVLIFGMKELNEVFDISDKKYFLFFNGKKIYFFVKKIIKPYFFKILVRFRLWSYIIEDKKKIATYNHKIGLFPIVLVESNFFQSEKFFDKNKIDFMLKNHFVEEAKKIISTFDSNFTKVFVHIRRGDYLNVKYPERSINLPNSYFNKAIERIKNVVTNPFFIFLSDDPDYVELNFKDIKKKYVSKNNMGIDLALMSLCEYGIMSNSSFSWWGAFFMKKKKKVFSPKYWYGWKQKVDSHIGIKPNWADMIEVE